MSRNHELDRRKVLALLGLGTAYGMLPKVAWAQQSSARRYYMFTDFGAPCRWMFDLFLNPDNQAIFNPNPHMATEYTGGTRYNNTRYRLVNINGLMLPPMWNFDLPAPGGATRKMRDELLPHMLHMRGMDANNAAHLFCHNLRQQPLGALTTTTALSGDALNELPLASVSTGFEFRFRSREQRSFVNVPLGGNPISTMMRPFLRAGNAQVRQQSQDLAAAMDAAGDRLSQVLIDDSREAAPVLDTETATRLLKRRDWGDLEARWTELFDKYKNLIGRAVRGTYPGINDKPIGVGNADRDATYNFRDTQVNNGDLRTMITNNTNNDNMARAFALAEFVAEHDLAGNITSDLNSLRNLSSNAGNFFTKDEHSTGRMVNVLLNTLYFAAVGACLMEFIAQLKAMGRFDQSVIDLGGEFNRNPRANGSGSDHAFRAVSCALYSGAISQPIIIGNVRRGTNEGVRRGTFGQSAANGAYGELSVGHFAATLAALLGTPSPVTAVPALIRQAGNTFESVLPTARIV